MEKKQSIGMEELCGDAPREFGLYFEHVRALKYEDKPNYAYLRKIFLSLFLKEGFEYDHVYDWTILKYLGLQEQKADGSLELDEAIEHSSGDESISDKDKSPSRVRDTAASRSSDKDIGKNSKTGTPPSKENGARLDFSKQVPKSGVEVVMPSSKTQKRAGDPSEGKANKKGTADQTREGKEAPRNLPYRAHPR